MTPRHLARALLALACVAGCHEDPPVCGLPLQAKYEEANLGDFFYPSSKIEQGLDLTRPLGASEKYGLTVEAVISFVNPNDVAVMVDAGTPVLEIRRMDAITRVGTAFAGVRLGPGEARRLSIPFKLSVRDAGANQVKWILEQDKDLVYRFSHGFTYRAADGGPCPTAASATVAVEGEMLALTNFRKVRETSRAIIEILLAIAGAVLKAGA